MELIVKDLFVSILWVLIGLTAFYPEVRWLKVIPAFLTFLAILAFLDSSLKTPSVFLQNILTLGYSSLRGKMSACPAYLVGANFGGGAKGMKNLPSPKKVTFHLIVLLSILKLCPPSL